MAYLVRVEGDKSLDVYALDQPKTWIGRADSCQIMLNDRNLSREHASFEQLDGQIAVIDNQSSNGTFVNKIPVSKMILTPGDRIFMGENTFIFYNGNPDEVDDIKKPPKLESEKPVMPMPPPDGTTEMFGLKKEPTDPEATKATYLQLKTLYALNQSISSITDSSQLYKIAGDSILLATDAERCVFWESSGSKLAHEPAHYSIAHGLAPNHRDAAFSEKALRALWKAKSPLFFKAELKPQAVESAITRTTHFAFVGAPICHGDKYFGVMLLDCPSEKKSFSKIDLDFVASIGRQIGLLHEHLSYLKSLEQNVNAMAKRAGATSDIIGQSQAVRRIHSQIAQVADSEATVLIHGESGSGKELVARSIHQQSRRSNKTFLAVNCAVLPETLIESELFGYEKGAFTGAYSRKIGHFEAAANGTLFLDEIGEMPLSAQAKMLRVLQEGEIMRVGGNKPIRVDVRIVAATNRDLMEMIRQNTFREDLYYRLNVVELKLPHLRERREDIPILAKYFFNQLRDTFAASIDISSAALKALEAYDWPGNIRQLRNAIEHSLVMANGEIIEPGHLPSYVQQTNGNASAASNSEMFQPISLEELEKTHIRGALKHQSGNKQKTAKLLGISRSTLYEKMKQYQIESDTGK